MKTSHSKLWEVFKGKSHIGIVCPQVQVTTQPGRVEWYSRGLLLQAHTPPPSEIYRRLARDSLSLTEADGIAIHRSQIGIHPGMRLHSYELERTAERSFWLSLVSDADGNPAMIVRYSDPVFGLII